MASSVGSVRSTARTPRVRAAKARMHATIVGPATLLACCAALPTAAPAGADPTPAGDFSFQFSTTRPGASTGLEFRQVYKHPNDPDAKPSPVERFLFAAPEGSVFDGAAVPACKATDQQFQQMGKAACPAESVVGTGFITVMTGVPGEQPFPADATVFNTPRMPRQQALDRALRVDERGRQQLQQQAQHGLRSHRHRPHHRPPGHRQGAPLRAAAARPPAAPLPRPPAHRRLRPRAGGCARAGSDAARSAHHRSPQDARSGRPLPRPLRPASDRPLHGARRGEDRPWEAARLLAPRPGARPVSVRRRSWNAHGSSQRRSDPLAAQWPDPTSHGGRLPSRYRLGRLVPARRRCGYRHRLRLPRLPRPASGRARNA